MKDFLARLNIIVPLILAFATDKLIPALLALINKPQPGDFDIGGVQIPTELLVAIVVFALTAFADFLPEPLKSIAKRLVEIFQKPKPEPVVGELLGEVVRLPNTPEDGKSAVKVLADRIIAVCPAELVAFRGVAEKLGGAEYSSVIPKAVPDEQK